MTRLAVVPGILAPEVVLPAQYYTAVYSAEHQPERRLMLAVLEDAVLTLLRHRGDDRTAARRLVREVDCWVDAGVTDWPFSFENVCAVLGFEAAAVRRRLHGLRNERPDVEPGRLPVLGRRVSGRRHRVSMRRSHRRALNGSGVEAGVTYPDTRVAYRATRPRKR